MAKITPEELKEVNELRSKLSIVIGDAGQVTLQKMMLQEDIKNLENKLTQNVASYQELLGEEDKLVKRLSEKYGVGSINFETGEFTPEK